eukprot:scaffold45236_cov71-Phaeocystis_antarctica.AAC.3
MRVLSMLRAAVRAPRRSRAAGEPTVEENAGDALAWGRRAASSQQTIASALEKLQPALQKSGID